MTSRHQKLRAERDAKGLCTRCGRTRTSAPYGAIVPCACRKPKGMPPSDANHPIWGGENGCIWEDETNLALQVIASRCTRCGKVRPVSTCPGCDKRIDIDRAGKTYHGKKCRERARRKRLKAMRDAAQAAEMAATA